MYPVELFGLFVFYEYITVAYKYVISIPEVRIVYCEELYVSCQNFIRLYLVQSKPSAMQFMYQINHCCTKLHFRREICFSRIYSYWQFQIRSMFIIHTPSFVSNLLVFRKTVQRLVFHPLQGSQAFFRHEFRMSFGQ